MIASAGLFVAAAGSVALLWLGRPYEVRTLPNGTLVRLERVAIERTSLRFAGPEWQRSLWELAGRRLLFADQAMTTTRSTDALTLEVTGSGVQHPTQFNTGILLDEHDCVFSGWQEYVAPDATRRSPSRAELTFYAYPRRGGSVRAGLHSRAGPVLFDTPVPATGTPSSWAPEPYPIRKQTDGWEFSLARIAPARLPDHLRPRAYFEVRHQGRPTSDWVPSSIRVSDGTGNSDQLGELAVEADGGVIFPGMCTREPAWKLETWFAPADPGRTAPDLEWTARNVTLAGSGKVALAEQSTRADDLTLELVGTAGKGDVQWRSGVYTLNQAPVVRVRATLPPNTPGATLTLVKVTDANGRVLLPRPRSNRLPATVTCWHDYQGSVIEHDFVLRLPAGPRKLNFTFRVHNMRKVDFLAKP